MFQSFDNGGFIRVNFHSDPGVVERINSHARGQGNVVASGPFTMGGYGFPILEDIAAGSHYQILKSPLPGDNVQFGLELEAALTDPNTVYSYVDAGNVTIVQVDGWDRSRDSLSNHGWSVLATPKTFKRLKTLNRPFRTYSVLEDYCLRVHIINDDDYTDADIEGLDPSIVERLLDGAFVIAPWIRTECVNNVTFPTDVNSVTQYNVDDFRRRTFTRRARHIEAWNARIFGPMIFSGAVDHDDPIRQRPGTLKGEAFVHTSDICERMRVDVIAARSALKPEVSNDKKTFILLESQAPKLEGVMSDLQTMINLPALFDPADVEFTTKEILNRALHGLKNNELLSYWFDMASSLFNRDTAAYDLQDVATLTKWNARAWVMSGMQITSSPWLFEQLARTIVSVLRPNDPQKLRFPIACAIRCQVISASYASMCGSDVEVEVGTARYIEELESVVVNDEDWLEMYPSHGGCDLDDFFVCYYRTIDGQKSIVLVRSPNDIGEYSIFKYVEGDFYPKFETVSQGTIEFPEIDNDPKLWPQRLSEAVAEGRVTYRGLPSENAEKDKSEPGLYTMNHVRAAIVNNKSSQACVGANVNSRCLWSLTVRDHRPDQLTTMEACIDAGAQGGSAADTDAVMEEAKEIVDLIVESTDGPIDAYLWNTRFAPIHKYPFPMERISSDGYITVNNLFRKDYARRFNEMAANYAQRHCVNKIDPLIHKLAALRLRDGYQLLVSSRASMVYVQDMLTSSGGLNGWDSIHGPIKARLEAEPSDFDRHNLVLALFSACHKVPTATSGKYSDQLVMNPDIFPFLLDALRYYGIAAYLELNDDSKVKRVWRSEWDLACTTCGTRTQTKNPVVLQAYHYNKGLCKTCRS